MKNKLTDLNNHLFAQLERLSDESLEGEKLQAEIARAKALTSVSDQVIGLGRLAIDAEKAKSEMGLSDSPVERLTHD